MSIAVKVATFEKKIVNFLIKNIIILLYIIIFSINIIQAKNLVFNTIADMVEKNLDAVVNISVTQYIETSSKTQLPILQPDSLFEEFFKDFFNEEGLEKYKKHNKNNSKKNPEIDNKKFKRKVSSLGSGFIISRDGYLVTNEHVINNADKIIIILNNGDEYKAKIIGFDKKTDIALLKIKKNNDFKFVEFGDDKKLRVGSWVVTIGNPFGFGSSVSAGIVSAHHRNLRFGPYDDFIQTDASINKGNSGGPLFNLNGKVVGVNAAIVSPTGGSVGIGFSIPASTVVPIIDQLKKFGKIKRGWLGVSIRDVSSDIAESIGMKEAYGAFVAKVFKDSPAQIAGIKRQDVIIKFNNKYIKNSFILPKIVANTKINTTVPVTVIRDGEEITLNVIIGLLMDIKDKANIKVNNNSNNFILTEIALGLKIQELNKNLNKRFKFDSNTKGLVVVGIINNSLAAEKMIRPGDRIIAAALKNISTLKELKNRINKTKSKGRKRILLLIKQFNGSYRSVALPLE